MKKITLLTLIFITTLSIAQEKEEKYPQDIDKKHEIKTNAIILLTGEAIGVSYEYLIDNESSFGTDLIFSFDSIDFNYALTPYYRKYFSEKFARGFFVEGFGTLFSVTTSNYDDNYLSEKANETGFALGVSIGGKFVSKDGFTAEVLLGFGRNLTRNNYNEVIGRLGVSLGYRF